MSIVLSVIALAAAIAVWRRKTRIELPRLIECDGLRIFDRETCQETSLTASGVVIHSANSTIALDIGNNEKAALYLEAKGGVCCGIGVDQDAPTITLCKGPQTTFANESGLMVDDGKTRASFTANLGSASNFPSIAASGNESGEPQQTKTETPRKLAKANPRWLRIFDSDADEAPTNEPPISA